MPPAPTRYTDPRAHELRDRYRATFGGGEIPVPVESIAEDLLGLRIEVADSGECSGMLIPSERLILVNASEAMSGDAPTRRRSAYRQPRHGSARRPPRARRRAVDGAYLVADAGMGAPVIQELVERLADLRLAAPRKATVVVPLKEGAIERVRRLVAKGPPFDPTETPLTGTSCC